MLVQELAQNVENTCTWTFLRNNFVINLGETLIRVYDCGL